MMYVRFCSATILFCAHLPRAAAPRTRAQKSRKSPATRKLPNPCSPPRPARDGKGLTRVLGFSLVEGRSAPPVRCGAARRGAPTRLRPDNAGQAAARARGIPWCARRRARLTQRRRRRQRAGRRVLQAATACKVPAKAFTLPSDRTPSAPELRRSATRRCWRGARTLRRPERGGSPRPLWQPRRLSRRGRRPSATFFHADEALRERGAGGLFGECPAAYGRASAFKALAEEELGVGYVGTGEGIVACLLRGGAAEFRRDDQHATLYLPLARDAGGRDNSVLR